ncbi:MAG: ATP-binding protein [Ktedonobacteraceae bacterium]
MNILLRRPGPPGVRLQLMIWYTIVFAALLFFTDALVYIQLRTSLITNLDAALQFQTQQVAKGISNDNGNGTITVQGITGDLPEASSDLPDPSLSRVNVTFGTLIRVLDAKGKVVRASPEFRALFMPGESLTQPLHGTPWQGDVLARDGELVRLHSVALTDSGVPFALVQVGESLTQLNSSLRSVLIELLVLAPFVLLLGACGSYWLATRAFVPIDRLTRTARQINAGDLHQRVPIPPARDEVYRLAQTFNEMIERLEQAFIRQHRFVADASHELRTPIAVIRSMTDLALLQDLSSQEYTTLLENINTETERLGHLISDLLALARADEGQSLFEREPVRLDLLVGAVVANAEMLALERDITIQVQQMGAVTIQGDEARLIQAIMNLLDNALLYTNAGGRVTLSIEKKPNMVILRIIDTGIGIAPEHTPYIFERFYRIDPARVRTEGNSSGLGLAIVKWIIQAHGGSIRVESKVGKGSTFSVTLPLLSTQRK